MVFSLETDENTLYVFPDEKSAIAYCEGVDVADGLWVFFGSDGCPLEPVFTEPAYCQGFTASNGKYFLRPALAVYENYLQAILPNIAAVDGIPPYDSVAAIKLLLTAQSTRTG